MDFKKILDSTGTLNAWIKCCFNHKFFTAMPATLPPESQKHRAGAPTFVPNPEMTVMVKPGSNDSQCQQPKLGDPLPRLVILQERSQTNPKQKVAPYSSPVSDIGTVFCLRVLCKHVMNRDAKI